MNFLKRNLPIILTGAGILVLLLLIISLSQTKPEEPPGLTTIEENELIAPHTYTRGYPEAAFSLVFFTNFTAPEEAEYQQTLQGLYEKNSRYLRIALRHFPTTGEATLAAKAAQIAGEQNKFWEFATRLYTLEEFTPDSLKSLAQELGMNIPKFTKDLQEEGFDAIIKSDVEDAEAFAVTGTPVFFLNTERLNVSSPLELQIQVQEQIDRVKEYEQKNNKTYDPKKDILQEQKESSGTEKLTKLQLKQLQKTREIRFTVEGWDPKGASVLKNQTVRWINETENTIGLEQLDKRYEELEEIIEIAPGDFFEFKFTDPGMWRYREHNTRKGAAITTQDY